MTVDPAATNKKTFFFDTNVILHDSSCIDDLGEHDAVIPITVLEELDNFKKGTQTINKNARDFMRRLDELSEGHLFNGGVSLGENKGKLMIRLEQVLHADLNDHFPNAKKPDHQILNIAYHAKKDGMKNPVLISKDVNLRMKAKAIGLMAEDYTKDHVRNGLSPGFRVVDECPADVVEKVYLNNYGINLKMIFGDKNVSVMPNEYLILQNETRSVLGHVSMRDGLVHRVPQDKIYGISPRNAEQSFAIHALCESHIPLVALDGKAGTGKTILALAAALEKRRLYRQIVLARPIVPLSNKDIGYLPGDIQSKIGPYMQPLYDNLSVIRNQFEENSDMHVSIARLLDDKKLIIEPLAYIRGRSLVKMYMIIDEAQNLTPHEVKTIVTRAGEGTKLIFTGDIEQIDHPYLDQHSNGLSYLIEKMQGQKLFAHVTLFKGERSELSDLASTLL
jgi:PhoH-like ATPase